jgi:Na+-transporting NADH:ubiquinone oxidoreductase subunit A
LQKPEGVEKHWFHGKHPAGNVGVQIHNLRPMSTSDKVWTLGVQEVITIGALFTEKRFNAERVVALTGAELSTPQYVKTHLGAKISDLIKGNLTNDHSRIISGDVLSGKQKDADSFLNYFDDQITVVEEGDDYELFGWLLPSFNTPSISKTFPAALIPGATFKANTNTHGEKRAFVVTGNYEEVPNGYASSKYFQVYFSRRLRTYGRTRIARIGRRRRSAL